MNYAGVGEPLSRIGDFMSSEPPDLLDAVIGSKKIFVGYLSRTQRRSSSKKFRRNIACAESTSVWYGVNRAKHVP